MNTEETISIVTSPKSRLSAFLLCTFLGALGIHRFYVGKWMTGILYLLTLGLLGVGVLWDWFAILFGGFRDDNGRKLLKW